MTKEEFHREEYKEALAMYRTEFQGWLQLSTVLGTINIAIIGFAVNTQKAGFFLISFFTSAVIFIIYSAFRRYLAAIAHRAVETR